MNPLLGGRPVVANALLSTVIEVLLGIINSALQLIISLLTLALGIIFVLMNQLFNNEMMTSVQNTFQMFSPLVTAFTAIGYGMIALLLVFHAVRSMGTADESSIDTPGGLIAGTVLAFLITKFGITVLNSTVIPFFQICNEGITKVMEAVAGGTARASASSIVSNFGAIGNKVLSMFDAGGMFAGLNTALPTNATEYKEILVGVMEIIASIITLLLFAYIMKFIASKFMSIFLATLLRMCLIFILLDVVPLVGATTVSKNTRQTISGWARLFIGNLISLIFSLIFIKAIFIVTGVAINNAAATDDVLAGIIGIFIGLVFVDLILNVEGYIQQLGLGGVRSFGGLQKMATEAAGAIFGLGADAFNRMTKERGGIAGGIGKAVSAIREKTGAGESIKENDSKEQKDGRGETAGAQNFNGLGKVLDENGHSQEATNNKQKDAENPEGSKSPVGSGYSADGRAVMTADNGELARNPKTGHYEPVPKDLVDSNGNIKPDTKRYSFNEFGLPVKNDAGDYVKAENGVNGGRFLDMSDRATAGVLDKKGSYAPNMQTGQLEKIAGIGADGKIPSDSRYSLDKNNVPKPDKKGAFAYSEGGALLNIGKNDEYRRSPVRGQPIGKERSASGGIKNEDTISQNTVGAYAKNAEGNWKPIDMQNVDGNGQLQHYSRNINGEYAPNDGGSYIKAEDGDMLKSDSAELLSNTPNGLKSPMEAENGRYGTMEDGTPVMESESGEMAYSPDTGDYEPIPPSATNADGSIKDAALVNEDGIKSANASDNHYIHSRRTDGDGNPIMLDANNRVTKDFAARDNSLAAYGDSSIPAGNTMASKAANSKGATVQAEKAAERTNMNFGKQFVPDQNGNAAMSKDGQMHTIHPAAIMADGSLNPMARIDENGRPSATGSFVLATDNKTPLHTGIDGSQRFRHVDRSNLASQALMMESSTGNMFPDKNGVSHAVSFDKNGTLSNKQRYDADGTTNSNGAFIKADNGTLVQGFTRFANGQPLPASEIVGKDGKTGFESVAGKGYSVQSREIGAEEGRKAMVNSTPTVVDNAYSTNFAPTPGGISVARSIETDQVSTGGASLGQNIMPKQYTGTSINGKPLFERTASFKTGQRAFADNVSGVATDVTGELHSGTNQVREDANFAKYDGNGGFVPCVKSEADAVAIGKTFVPYNSESNTLDTFKQIDYSDRAVEAVLGTDPSGYMLRSAKTGEVGRAVYAPAYDPSYQSAFNPETGLYTDKVQGVQAYNPNTSDADYINTSQCKYPVSNIREFSGKGHEGWQTGQITVQPVNGKPYQQLVELRPVADMTVFNDAKLGNGKTKIIGYLPNEDGSPACWVISHSSRKTNKNQITREERKRDQNQNQIQ